MWPASCSVADYGPIFALQAESNMLGLQKALARFKTRRDSHQLHSAGTTTSMCESLSWDGEKDLGCGTLK